jgi:hypothetical protein
MSSPYESVAVLPVIVFNDEYLAVVDIPLKWTGALNGDSGRFTGEREHYITNGFITMSPSSCEIYFGIPHGDLYFPPGYDTLAYLYFTLQDTGFVNFDTISGGGPEMYLCFVDSNLYRIQPHIERPVLYHISTYPPGDVNSDEKIDIGDVVFLISYMFRGGTPPNPLLAGDVNGDCLVDLGDVVYLISYLYKDGPAPLMGCASYKNNHVGNHREDK